MDENDQVTRRRAEEIVSEAMELAIARMVMEAEAGRNRDEIGQALEAIRVREASSSSGGRKSALKSSMNKKSQQQQHVNLRDTERREESPDLEDTRL